MCPCSCAACAVCPCCVPLLTYSLPCVPNMGLYFLPKLHLLNFIYIPLPSMCFIRAEGPSIGIYSYCINQIATAHTMPHVCRVGEADERSAAALLAGLVAMVRGEMEMDSCSLLSNRPHSHLQLGCAEAPRFVGLACLVAMVRGDGKAEKAGEQQLTHSTPST